MALKIKKCDLEVYNFIIDLGTEMKLTYHFLANLAEQRLPAEPPKFWPRSTRGRKFKVGILSSN